MAETITERLNRLQEADLGTARREYISTVDRSFNNTRVQAIEASRRSNVPGSAEQRLAAANKDLLDAWADVHKKIGDTGDLEDLDHLLNGQSHRLRINSIVRASEGKNHGHTSAVQNMPDFRGTSTRASSMTTKPGPNPPRARSALDPALDRNNVRNTNTPNKNLKALKSAGGPANSEHNAPTLRTRRPFGNFSRIISSPQTFLAVARGMATTNQTARRPTTEKPKAQGAVKAEDSLNGDLSLALKTTPKPTHPKSPNVGQPADQKVTTQRATSHTSVDEVVTPDVSSGSMSMGSHEKSHPAASIDTMDQVKEALENTNPQDIAANAKVSTPTLRPQKATEMLLDLSYATPENSGPEPGMSPALEELKGLEFTQFHEPQKSSSPGFASANRKLDFGEDLHKKQTSELDDTEATTDLIDEELAEEYNREIEIICQLLERTSLSGAFSSKLIECKEELESRLRARRARKLDTKQSQQPPIPPAPKPKEPEVVAPVATEGTPQHSRKTTDVRTSTPTSQSRLNAAAPQFMPKSFTEYRSLSNATSTDSSTAFHSTPTKVISKTQPEDASSDSTAVPATGDKPSLKSHVESISTVSVATVQRTSSATNLFGDHLLLPGRTRSPEVSHIFGDHLLPGRRVTPLNVAQPTVSPPTGSVLSHAAAPVFDPISFSTPRALKIVNPNAAITNEAKTPNGSSLTPSAPHFEPANKVVDVKKTDVANPIPTVNTTIKTAQRSSSMMESMYAPKPKAASNSTAQKKPSASQGLSASGYSNAEWI
ncbi:hypothetical protein BDW62DRAFT_198224 [Aspergillus aurantiobrunneus]